MDTPINKSVIQVADRISAHVVVFPPLGKQVIIPAVDVGGTSYVVPQSVWEGGELIVQCAGNQQGQLCSAFLIGKDVPTLVPYFYKAAKSREAHLVLYVFNNLHNVYALQECGFVIILASTPVEFHDLSLVGSILSHQVGTPVCVWLTAALLDSQYEFKTPSESILPKFSNEIANSQRSENAKELDERIITLFNGLACGDSDKGIQIQNKYSCLQYFGSSTADHLVVAYPSVAHSVLEYIKRNNIESIGVIVVRVIRPWMPSLFLSVVPRSIRKVLVMDLAPLSFIASPPQLFLDVAAAFQSDPDGWDATPELVSMKYQQDTPSNEALVELILANLVTKDSPVDAPLVLPSHSEYPTSSSNRSTALDTHIASPYTQMLKTAFGERLRLEDASHSHSIESIFGEYVSNIREREAFADLVATASNLHGSTELREALKIWHRSRTQATLSDKYGNAAIKLIETELPNVPQLLPIFERRKLFFKLSLWILGAEHWATDIQYSGIHHVISSGVNVNLLLLDTQIYPSKTPNTKKDVGLYAMNYGNAYVASVAIYTNYTHVLHSLLEAENFDGPSVVLAYLPLAPSSKSLSESLTTSSDAIVVMKNSKIAVDMGIWPLYRWNPDQQKQNGKGFTLESERIKEDLKAFLAKENELSLIVDSVPTLPLSVPNDLELRMNALEASFSKLSAGIAPLLILYGSDTGHAESLAKKMETRGKKNKRNARALPMDSLTPTDLQAEPTVFFIVATAGQGEFPANSKEFWKQIHKMSVGDLNLEKMNYSVFALGDSHYWPPPAGEIYFCKPGKELDSKLEALGGKKICPLGLGDDQDADGYLTGFEKWEKEVWEYLGVAGDAGAVSALTDDQNKINSNFLRGTIAQGLVDTSTGALAELDTKITKFHGIYQQDDRDLRDARKAQGLEKAFSFMVRLRIPGGIVTPSQYLALDAISDQYASPTIRLTTRQTIQYHGIIKKNLRTAMQAINKTLLDTIAACGDVNRNVLCTSNPALAPSVDIHNQLVELATNWSLHMLPKTGAYREIWLDDKLIKGGETVQDFEPIYGPTYLPRKFKAVVAIPPYNDVDIFAHDLGYIAIVENDQIIGYNVTVGGGMGMTHGNKKTFPRIADVMGFVEKHQAIDVGEKVVLVQRDFGDRTNRKHARLKYTIEDRGIDWFRSEVEARLGYKLQPAKPFHFTDNADRYGWVQGGDGKWHYTMFIQNGRVKDTPEYPLRTGLRELAKQHKGDFRFTANQNLIISNVDPSDKNGIDELMEKYKIANKRNSAIRLNSMACVALPTCGLAFSESERYLPSLVSLIDEEIMNLGLWEEPITIRMTGCPNGCARPYIAEIGLVGKAPGIYNLYIGGGFAGERLNKLFKEAANEKEILSALIPVLQRYAKEKQTGERFGDFAIRVGIIKAVTSGGRDFHDY